MKVEGGKKAYKYSFKLTNKAGKVVAKKTQAKNKWTWKATKKGKYNLKVTVSDQLGRSVSKTIKNITVQK